jgi:hypothetical protein
MADEINPSNTLAPITQAERDRQADAAKLGVPASMLTPAPAPSSGALSPAKPLSSTPVTARDKLRAFEDKHFGKDVPRINGEIERGVGSSYASMTPHQKAHYASLEHLVKAEKAAGDASAALADAESKHEHAKKASDAADKAVVDADKADKLEADRLAAERAQTAKTAA